MSKIISLVRVEPTRERVPASRLVMVDASVREPNMHTMDSLGGVAYLYNIQVTLGRSYKVHRGQQLDLLLKETRRSLSEELFGEYRRPLLECLTDAAEIGCGTRQGDELVDRLKRIIDSMFDAEPYEEPK